MKRLWALVDTLPPDRRPALLRGDVGYGNDATMCEAEARGILYLFKIKRSRNIQKLFRILSGGKGWKDCGSGWEALEQRVKLNGWQFRRRVLFIRRPAEKKVEAVGPKKTGRKPRVPKKSTALVPTAPAVVKQAEFDFVKDIKGREWDYCVLVTNDEKMDAVVLSQLYRDRGDCENNFDEFKNQWGWSGFTTKRLKPCKAMARLIAIVANLWNVFVRLADPDAHREPVTSRPAFLNIIGRIVMNGGRRVIHLTSTHAEADAIRASLCLIGKFLEWVNSIAEQLNPETTWTLVLAYAFRKLLRLKPSRGPIPALIPA